MELTRNRRDIQGLIMFAKAQKDYLRTLEQQNAYWKQGANVELGSLIVDYFQKLFKSTPGNPTPIIGHIQRRISTEYNKELIKPILRYEVK